MAFVWPDGRKNGFSVFFTQLYQETHAFFWLSVMKCSLRYILYLMK